MAGKKSLQNIFAETGANIHQISKIVPAGTSAYFSFSYQNLEKFKTNLQEQNPKALKDDLSTALLKTSSEAGILTMGQNELLVLNSMNVGQTEEILAPYINSAGEFRGIEIFEFKNKDIFQRNLQPLLSIQNLRFHAIIGGFGVFAENQEQLATLIANFRNRNMLHEKPYFKEALDHLSEASNMLIVANTKDLKNLLEQNLAAPYKPEMANLEFGNYRIAAFQVTAEKGYSHLHGVFLHAEAEKNQIKPSQLLSIALEAPLLTEPQFVKNHLNNEMDIAVQDINNKLYLISNKGEIFWEKQLDGPVLGKIHQVDLLKNNKFQLAFTTSNQVEVLDRNGNEVKPFPIKFRDKITQPLSLFDYDKNRNYRFLVTQGQELFMFDRKGNMVSGFDFSKTASEVKFPPKHIRIGNKDYILIAENSGKLNILSRQGKVRVRVRETFEFSENGWFQHEGNFISGSASGALISIDEKGGITRDNLSLVENYKINATPNLLVSLSENVLKIREKEVSLDFGLYTSPEIFLINNIYYIALTDLQAQKVYIFNSQAELLPGFPVYGTSAADINDSDNQPGPELTVKGGDNEVLVYRL